MKPRALSSCVPWHAVLLASTVALGLTGDAYAQCPETSVPTVGLPQAGAEFGASVALAGDTAVIGAPGWSPPGGQPEGAVIVSVWTGSAWVSQMLPRPASIGPGSRFGQDVAINEDASVIAVGAPLHDGTAIDCGKVVIYEWDPALSSWSLSLEVDGLFASGFFGHSVTASGQRVAAGEPGGAFALGTVNITRRTAPFTWVSDGFLAGTEPFALFGFDVALSGDLLAVGSPLDDDTQLDEGCVDVYEWLSGPWVLREHITGGFGFAGTFFGWSVDLADDLVVGAPGATSNNPGGIAQIYHWDGAKYLWWFTHWNDSTSSRLGQSVAISVDRVLMGAPGLDEGLGADAGRMTAVQSGPWGGWSVEVAYLTSSSPEPGAQFAFATALSGQRALTGKPFADPGGKLSAGLVYAYDLGTAVVHTDLAQGLAGQNGVTPVLSGIGGMCDTSLEWLQLTDGRPFAPTWLVLGTALQALPFKGGVLVPQPDFIFSLSSMGAQGILGLAFNMPTGLPAFSAWLQIWIKDADGPAGFSATNGLRADFPPY